MSPNTLKGVWICFLVCTIISGGVVIYSSHIYFREYRAIRLINISVNGFCVILSGENAWTETNITIENPSKHSFRLKYLDQKLYLNSVNSEGYIFTTHLSNQISLEPHSNFNLTIKIIIPNYKINKVTRTVNRNWLAMFYVTLESHPSGTLFLNIYRELS